MTSRSCFIYVTSILIAGTMFSFFALAETQTSAVSVPAPVSSPILGAGPDPTKPAAVNSASTSVTPGPATSLSPKQGQTVVDLEIRDPFQKPIDTNLKKSSVIAMPTAKATPKAELEKFSLDQIRVTAILSGLNRTRAMVSTPAGRVYYITEREKMGLHNGVVRRITPDTVFVREKFINSAGFEEIIDTELKLPEDEKKGSLAGSLTDLEKRSSDSSYPAPSPSFSNQSSGQQSPMSAFSDPMKSLSGERSMQSSMTPMGPNGK